MYIIESLIKLLDIIFWPITALILAFVFRKPLSHWVARASKVSFELAGQKLTIERQVEKELADILRIA